MFVGLKIIDIIRTYVLIFTIKPFKKHVFNKLFIRTLVLIILYGVFKKMSIYFLIFFGSFVDFKIFWC